MFKRIYKQLGMPDKVDRELVIYFAEKYFAGIEEGFGATLANVDYDTPDYEMLRNLKESCYHFSAAKNYQQLKATTRALIDENGKLRSFNDFKQAAFELNNEHVTSWLQAEYNFAVAGGQMSGTWTRAMENKEVLPLLKYITVGDSRVRPEHAELNGVVRKLDDTFWDMYYPPNGWNCRCDVQSLHSGTETPVERIITPADMPAMFKTNLAKKGLAFPPDHPYYNGLPHQVSEQAQKLADGK